jgi:hypothetical protein
MLKFWRTLSAVALLSTLLASCGGGGDNGWSAADDELAADKVLAPFAQTLSVDASNVNFIAETVFRLTSNMSGVAVIAGLPVATQVNSRGQVVPVQLPELAQQFRRGLQALLQLQTVNETTACREGGWRLTTSYEKIGRFSPYIDVGERISKLRMESQRCVLVSPVDPTVSYTVWGWVQFKMREDPTLSGDLTRVVSWKRLSSYTDMEILVEGPNSTFPLVHIMSSLNLPPQSLLGGIPGGSDGGLGFNFQYFYWASQAQGSFYDQFDSLPDYDKAATIQWNGQEIVMSQLSARTVTARFGGGLLEFNFRPRYIALDKSTGLLKTGVVNLTFPLGSDSRTLSFSLDSPTSGTLAIDDFRVPTRTLPFNISPVYPARIK